MENAQQLEPRTTGHRQGGVYRRRSQPALRRHLAPARRMQAKIPLREALLRPRRYGEPDQGVPARPLCRPHLDRHDARQPAAAMVRLDGLRAAVRAAPIGLTHTPFIDASCGTIRLKLLKIGATVRISVRRIKIAMASGCPAALAWSSAAVSLNAAASARGSPV